MKEQLLFIFLFVTLITWGQQQGIAHIAMAKDYEITSSIKEQNECTINSIHSFLAKQIPLKAYKTISKEALKYPLKIQLRISETGEIYKFKNSKKNNKRLEKAIKKALTHYIFVPATSNDGKPHKSQFTFYFKSIIIEKNIKVTPFYFDFEKSPNNVMLNILQRPITLGSCNQKNSFTQQFKCTTRLISAHISENFNMDLIPSLHLKPGTKKIYAMFTINWQGKIKDVRVKAPHKKLEEEALRIVKLLPKFKPAIFNGQAIAQKFSLPIIFKVI